MYVRGLVRDSVTNLPVNDVTISAFDENDNLIDVVQSHTDGTYSFLTDQGMIRMRAVAYGYQPVDQYLDITG